MTAAAALIFASGLSANAAAQWVTVAVVIGAVFWLTRGGTGSAVQELSKANEVLTQRVHDLGAEVRDLRVENAELKQKTDFHSVIAEHERREVARSERMLTVLELIAARLGPDMEPA